MLKKYNFDVKTAFYTPCLLVSCLVTDWPPVAGKLYLSGHQSHANFSRFYSCCMRLAATRVQFACDWRPLRYNLHATGGHSGTIYMRLATSRIQTLHALAASCMQSRQFFASMLREPLFELKNEDPIKNLRIYTIHMFAKAYPLTLCMARSNLVRQFL
jgi:hypothetical protein